MIPMNFSCSSGFLTNSFMMKLHKILNLFLSFFFLLPLCRSGSGQNMSVWNSSPPLVRRVDDDGVDINGGEENEKK